MKKVTVWTRQNHLVLDSLLKNKRHVAKKEYVCQNEDAMSMITAYNWLASQLSKRSVKPEDADYPIWISMKKETTTIPSKGTVLLELEIDPQRIMFLNIAKWGMINNFSYIPLDEEDERSHKKIMEAYGISDAKAYMSRFYPELKKEIQDSWIRAFDEEVKITNDHSYGLIWEINEEDLKAYSSEI